MIYPTRFAVIATAAGAPLALAIAAIAPARWYLAVGWPLAILVLCAIDAVRGRASATASLDLPSRAYVGATEDCTVSVAVSSAPRHAELALDVPAIVGVENDGRFWIPLEGEKGAVLVPLAMLRRGNAHFGQLWVRWTGPLGLVWQQKTVTLALGFPIMPDLRLVHEQSARLLQRHSFEGLLAQSSRGEGSDFDTLVEFRPGMDRRSIDWKQSARHAKLLAKRYRSERNNQIVFAVDSGRQMCDSIAGVPRVDRAVSAMLLAAWVALKLGDRVALFAFDSRPRVASGLASGAGAFAEIQRLAAEIDYSSEETNYSFGLTSLAAPLGRRSMLVLFTEFTDAISAEFLVRAVRRLVDTHLVVLVVFRDEDLESIAASEPQNADDVTRAITAASLLKQRRLVITGLQHLGVHIVESEHDRVGQRLVESYMSLKRRNML